MNGFPDGKKVSMVKNLFPAGTRVMLLRMDDVQAPPIGTCGTVWTVDDVATIHVKWDNGSTLGVAYGVDAVIKI